MPKVTYLPGAMDPLQAAAIGPALANGGGGTHDGGMEQRLTTLETRLDTILPTLATKADIEGVRSDIKGWMLATVLTIIGTLVAVVVAMNTLWKPPSTLSATQAAPIIIQVPAYAQPTTGMQPAVQAKINH
ncbi:hypothetical protein [Frateuria aurantia]|uniref:hypothetical protein n=1 Tax=Frateuria aurantia TaxID=81475 RepID=UPI0012EA4345|nr:hypothetical protein [Frateuria aurantia]